MEKKQTISIWTSVGPREIKAEVHGHLAIHSDPAGLDPSRWKYITHVPTGFAVMGRHPLLIAQARAAVQELSQFDWNWTDPRHCRVISQQVSPVVDKWRRLSPLFDEETYRIECETRTERFDAEMRIYERLKQIGGAA